ncbi:MAG: hypothetical protein TRG1_1941 [Flavobacteriaceae bacterium FS1-H7996/R]|nr:MAG: hypothetical protein TRG1_1941 [Flavobacteriaceae bacterium FS1-H7996/R]
MKKILDRILKENRIKKIEYRLNDSKFMRLSKKPFKRGFDVQSSKFETKALQCYLFFI